MDSSCLVVLTLAVPHNMMEDRISDSKDSWLRSRLSCHECVVDSNHFSMMVTVETRASYRVGALLRIVDNHRLRRL
jgi:hypothetical protein